MPLLLRFSSDMYDASAGVAESEECLFDRNTIDRPRILLHFYGPEHIGVGMS